MWPVVGRLYPCRVYPVHPITSDKRENMLLLYRMPMHLSFL